MCLFACLAFGAGLIRRRLFTRASLRTDRAAEIRRQDSLDRAIEFSTFLKRDVSVGDDAFNGVKEVIARRKVG